MPDKSRTEAFGFLQGTGELGRLISGHDWSATTLGPIEQWPKVLRSVVSTILRSPQPTAVIWSRDAYIIYNEAYARLIEARHPALLGASILTDWPEREDFSRHVLEAGFRGETLSYRNQKFDVIRKGQPSEMWVDLDYLPLIDDAGEVGGILSLVRDRTASVHSDRRNSVELERLRAMFEQSPGFMLFASGPELVCTIANSSMMRLLGSRKLVGLPLREALPEVMTQGFFDIARRCLETGQSFTGTGEKLRLQRGSSGELEDRYVDYVLQPVFDDEGNVTGLFVEGFDVTNHVRTTAALRESEARFREAANAAPVLIWITDNNKSVVWTNKRWLEFTGRALSAELGYGWTRGIHPEDINRLLATYNNAFDRREEFRNTFRMRNRDGQWRYMENVGIPRVSEDGSFIGYIGTCIDVTESRLIEAELRRFNERLEAEVEARTAELEAANDELRTQIAERERIEDTLRQIQRLDAIGQLTSGAAHDFNNLLTIILGNIGFLERALKQAEAAPKTLERLGHIRTAADRGAKLTAQLLAFSRKQRLEARSANLNAVIGNMRGLLQSSIGGSYHIQTSLEPDLWNAMVDTTQIELVILNLAINGRDAMNVGGVLTISTANATLGAPIDAHAPPPGEYVAVSVKDVGTGMTPEVLARVYEPFFTTKGVGRGSGLGLPQVFGFVKQSGGGINIATEIGKGTTVTIYLPRSAQTDANETKTHTNDPRPAKLENLHRILLVDDDDAVREVAASILSDLGCQVIEANSGQSAVNMIHDGELFDLLVVDFAMPGMNGVEVATIAKQHMPKLPVLVVTGYADMTALESMTRERIIQKPYSEDAFIQAVTELLGDIAKPAAQPAATLGDA